MQAEVDGRRSARTSISLGYLLDEWLATVELEDSTRETCDGYIERTIRPMLGSVSSAKLTTRTLETLYAELRRCRTLCDGRPTVVHRAEGTHDCAKAKTPSTSRAALLSGTPPPGTTSDPRRTSDRHH